jgi:hypothetical protein
MGLVKFCFLALTGHQLTKSSSFPYDPEPQIDSINCLFPEEMGSLLRSSVKWRRFCQGNQEMAFLIEF